MGMLDGKVALVTGAGRGIGRAEALLFASEGAAVVVNDVGASVAGEGHDAAPAEQVAEEIKKGGGRASVDDTDVTNFEAVEALISRVVGEYGQIDIVVNNAGILRDRMVVNMSEQEWDAVIAVHLKGTFNVTRHAAAYWRARSKAGESVSGRIINTSSPSGLYGNVGQSNYGAAKAGIAGFTVITAQELKNYGVTVNAISPSARTRMTEQAFGSIAAPGGGFDAFAPENIAPIVAYLATDDAAGITGQVFSVQGGSIALLQGWTPAGVISREEQWTPTEIASAIDQIVPGKKIEPDPMSARLAAGQQSLQN
ncbi:MAG TPA: SDR family oxidoreductase [Actinomycetota bacterium]|nr:SDR family oxidoreductase [Actinomycetota bacterium]